MQSFTREELVQKLREAKGKGKGKGVPYGINQNLITKAKTTVDPEKGDFSLNIPFDSVKSDDLPNVSILTITKNRSFLFPVAISNWNKFEYPRDKLEWVILDDGHEDLTEVLQKAALHQESINYIRTSTPSNTLGDKRNFSVSKAKYDHLVIMDDDDFYFKDSIMSKIVLMKIYNKPCVFSNNLGVYDTVSHSSFVTTDFSDVPEASLAFTRNFWEKGKFGKVNKYEAFSLVNGREKQLLVFPFWFNLIAITHGFNTTVKSTSTLRNKTELPSFYDTVFTKEFKEIIPLPPSEKSEE